MTNNLISAIKALMDKYSIASMIEQLTIVQAIDSNNDEIQALQAVQPLYVYKAIVSQSGASAPTADVLVNTFPSGIWSYEGIGVYTLELGTDLGSLKTTRIQQSCYNGTTAFNIVGSDVGTFYQIDTYDVTRVASDDMLSGYTLIIEKYA